MFAENLKKLRKEKGLSQEEMAAKLNVVSRTYGSWERNEREPDFSTLCKIADFFNVSTDYILGRVPMNIEVNPQELLPDSGIISRRCYNTIFMSICQPLFAK